MVSTTFPIEEAIPGLYELWSTTLGEPSIRIAIIDGLVDTSIPLFDSSRLEIHETYLGSNLESDRESTKHGTHIASIIWGQHDSKVKGIAPNCTGLIFPIFKDDGKGGIRPCSQVDLARTILQAVAAGANVINVSGGEFSSTGTSHPILSRAINHCYEQSVLIVAAAGNDGCECLHIPGALPSVLAVGAMDSKGNPLGFSNWGKTYQVQGILALGENIDGASLEGKIVKRTGTSFATPIVSGIAGLLMSLQKREGLKPSASEIKEILLESAIGCDDLKDEMCQRLLKGRLNISGALSLTLKKLNNMKESAFNQSLSNHDESESEDSLKSENTLSNKTLLPSAMKTTSDEPQNTITEVINSEQKANEKGVQASECSCGNKEKCSCGNKSPQLVFAIGKLGFDFGYEARRDSITQHMGGGNPNDPEQLLKYLKANPWDADSIIWTLRQDSIPIYAIRPMGAFIAEGYGRIREFLNDQIKEGAEFVSIPGVIIGRVQLMSGEIVPVINPELRCMYNWNIAALLKEVVKSKDDKLQEAVSNFLQRIYHEFRNLGITPQERAINYTGTNAFTVTGIFAETLRDKIQLDTIEVEPSPLCRLGSDCWDVKLTFFDPENQFQRARKVYRYTVDVSDICPVMVGEVRSWFVR